MKKMRYTKESIKKVKEFSDTAQNFGPVYTTLEEFENGARFHSENASNVLLPHYAEGNSKTN